MVSKTVITNMIFFSTFKIKCICVSDIRTALARSHLTLYMYILSTYSLYQIITIATILDFFYNCQIKWNVCLRHISKIIFRSSPSSISRTTPKFTPNLNKTVHFTCHYFFLKKPLTLGYATKGYKGNGCYTSMQIPCKTAL